MMLDVLTFLAPGDPKPVGTDQFKQVRVWLRLGAASAHFGPAAWQGLLGLPSFRLNEVAF